MQGVHGQAGGVEDEEETTPEIDAEQTVELGPAEGEFQIFVYPMTGEAITLDVQDSYTITMLKAKIQDKENVPWFEIQLMFGPDLLRNNQTLNCCLIPRNANLTMVRLKASVRDLIDIFQFKEPPTLYNLMKFTKKGVLEVLRDFNVGLIHNHLMKKELMFSRLLIVWPEIHAMSLGPHRLNEIDLSKDIRVIVQEEAL